jgi:OOP family OmpA-OmpF porin
MKKIAVALLLSTAVVAPAFAADNGYYAGVTVGGSRTQNPFVNAALTKSSDTVFGVLGGYQFTKNWGAEAFYTTAGKFTATTTGNTATGKSDAWGVNAVGTLPMSDAFALYGKLGFASVKTSASSTLGDVSSATRSAVTVGLGGIYNVNQSVGIRFGWDRYGAAVNTALSGKGNFNIDTYTVGAVFKF